MADLRDPAIKLFGMKIPLADADPGAGADQDPVDEEEERWREITKTHAEVPKLNVMEEKDMGKPVTSSYLNSSHEDIQTSSQDDKVCIDSKLEQDQSGTDTSGHEKVLKKPDKILSCPRCKSLDTKFCYYNNYNVNQPRYFCKNCQRYWTAGGTMRNVPVGAGRRKSKLCGHHQGLSSGLSPPARHLNGNGAVLMFGAETPQCESISSVLNVGEKKIKAGGENDQEPQCELSVTPSNCVENEIPEKAVPKEQNDNHECHKELNPMHPMQYMPAPPWPYWGPGWNDVAATAPCLRPSENGISNPAPWIPPAMFAPSAFCTPTIPFPFMPAPYWPFMSSWPNGAWNVPWLGPGNDRSNSENGAPILGKRARDAGLPKEEKREKSLWAPKALKIDDPNEAAKSSIWSTLGIKPDISMKRSGLFKAFQSVDESRDRSSTTVQNLHANPAALSRSQMFHEST